MKTILRWWHKRRGYHAAPAILDRFPFHVVQVCSCGETRVTFLRAEEQDISFVKYDYYWA